MGLIERIKSALGLGASSSTSQPAASSTDGPSPGEDPGSAGDGASGDGVDVTVEHEPATASEDAVKGTDTAADNGPTTATDSGPTTAADSTADAEADAAAETEETGDAAGDEDDGTAVDESEADEDSSAGAPTDPAPDAELEDIKGIGPTYADRLREAGVDGVGALAEADPAALSEETEIAESRVENWVEQAKLY